MKKILVVDDQEQNTYLLKQLLAGHGYQVQEANNGATALEMARMDPPALIISDILMPVMDGFSLCQAWMQDVQLRNIPFVFYTATYTDPKDQELALQLGAARFIIKPVELEEFVFIIGQVIGEVETGLLATPPVSITEEATYYRMYNARLIQKLEDKMLQLAVANRTLEEDITQRQQAEQEIRRLLKESQRRLSQVEALHSIDLAINASMDLRTTLNIVLMHVVSLLDVDAADILLFVPGLQQFRLSAKRGFKTELLENVSVRAGSSFAGRVAFERNIVLVSGELAPQADRDFFTLYEREGFFSYAGAPLIAKGRVNGVLEVYHRSIHRPEPEWLHLLDTLSGQAAIAIDNAQLFEGLQKSNSELALAYDATIAGWSRAMDLRDKETEGHTQRVTDLSLRLAQAMNVPESELTHIRRGALLHDIGKMGVQDSILLKPGHLTDEERIEMRKHPEFAYDMLSSIRYLQPALDIPYSHHEKWDGTGYPRGLKGDAIPLAARIFAVVDVWDAVTSDRPYRRAWSKEQALEYIKEQSGKYFDPQVVDVFMGMVVNMESQKRL